MWQRVLTRGGGSDEDKGIACGRNRPCFALVSAEQSTLEIVWTQAEEVAEDRRILHTEELHRCIVKSRISAVNAIKASRGEEV